MTEDEQAIRQLVAIWMSASRSGDVATVLDLMTDDVVFMVPGREPFGKDAFAATSQATADTRIEGENEIVELQVLGDWAFLRGHITMTATQPDGSSMHRAGYTLTLLRKSEGRWRLARDANLLTATAVPLPSRTED